MKCDQHERDGCAECFIANSISLIQALRLDARKGKIKPGRSMMKARKLMKEYKELELNEEQLELCRSLVSAIAHALTEMQVSLPDVAFIDPSNITNADRELYRNKVKSQKWWIGLSELVTLCRLFRIKIKILDSETGLDIISMGDQYQGNYYHLIFSGSHYEPVLNNTIIKTTPQGDCALEAFLLIATNRYPPGYLRSGGKYQIKLERLLNQFRQVPKKPGRQEVDSSSRVYKRCVANLRSILAASMSDEELNDAIVAEQDRPTANIETGHTSDVKESNFPRINVQIAVMRLPWFDPFSIRTKKINQMGYQELEPKPLSQHPVYIVGANYTHTEDAFSGAWSYLTNWHEKLDARSTDDELYERAVDAKSLGFLQVTASELGNPTHLGFCLLAVHMTHGTSYFMCSAANMKSGNGDMAKAVMSTPGNKNDLHSEKYEMGVCLFILEGMGLKPNEQKLGKLINGPLKFFGTRILSGQSLSCNIKEIDVMFINIGPMCDSCVGFWRDFRRTVMSASKAPRVRGWAFYYSNSVKNAASKGKKK